MTQPWTEMVEWPTPTKGSTMAQITPDVDEAADDRPMFQSEALRDEFDEDTRTPAERRADERFAAEGSPLLREARASVALDKEGDGQTFSVDDATLRSEIESEHTVPIIPDAYELEEPPMNVKTPRKSTGKRSTIGVWTVYSGTTPSNSVAGHLHADELSALREVADSKGKLGMVLVPWGQSLSETLAAAAE